VNAWYYDGNNVELVVDVVGVPTGAPLAVRIVPALSPAVVPDAALYGVKGAINRGEAAKANLDLDWSGPNTNSVGPAYLSRLAVLGEVLSATAGSDLGAWVAAATSMPSLLSNASAQVLAMNNPPARQAASMALLQVAAM
jgi:hypothetical protein